MAEIVWTLEASRCLDEIYQYIADREVREILYGHYRIAYLVANEQRIEVLGIFHSAMEIERYLR